MIILPFLLFAASVVAGRDLKFVQAIWRHGDRAPTGLPYPNDLYQENSWPRGWGQLTSIGMEQHNELGQFFRRRYTDFINTSYVPSQAYMRSSDTDRALASAQAFLSGMYPATGYFQWSQGNAWQPIPVHGATAGENDWLCKCTSVKCPNYELIYNADESRDSQTYTEKYKDYFAMLAQQNTTGNTNFSYSDVNGMYDITRELLHNLTDLQPTWINQSFPQYDRKTTLEISAELRYIRYFNQFGTQQKSQYFGSYLLNIFITNAQTVAAGQQQNPDRMLWYSSHDTVLSSLMYTMNLGNGEMPPYAACFFMEVYNNNGVYETEFYYRNSSEVAPFRLTIPGCTLPCPVDQLAQIYKGVVQKTTDDALKNCGAQVQQQCSSQNNGAGCLSPRPPSFEQEKMLSGSSHNEPQSFVNTTKKDATSNLVDLEDIVLKWAKLIFDTTKSKSESKIKKKYISYNINWTKLFQESLEPEYAEAPKLNRSGPTNEKVLFKTTFTNTTKRDQEYSFKTERATRSTSTVIIEKGVCRGMEVSLKLKTPCEVVEANAGFHQEVMLNHIGENTQEEELVWGVDSNVRVPPSSEASAELVILEEQIKKDFAIQNRLSGKVLVTVTNLKENNSLITVLEGNIAEIIRALPDHTAKGFSFEGNLVKYETRGSCLFKYGVEQKVRINEKALDGKHY